MPRTHRKKKGSLWEPQELRKEEVRGIFTIGVLSFLLGVRFAYGESTFIKIFGSVITLSDVTYPFLFFWGIYILLTCVALSDDVISDSSMQFIPRMSKELAQGMFFLGILALLAIATFIFWPFVILVLGYACLQYYRLKGQKRRSKK